MEGLPDILKRHYLQSLNKALDLFIEFKFCKGDFYNSFSFEFPQSL